METDMTDLNKYLNMLKSPKASIRYDACEELRVATESSPEVVLALEEASQDEDESVAERARLALASDTHVRMASKMGRSWAISIMGSQSKTEPETEQPVIKAKSLAIASLVLGIVGTLGWLSWIPYYFPYFFRNSSVYEGLIAYSNYLDYLNLSCIPTILLGLGAVIVSSLAIPAMKSQHSHRNVEIIAVIGMVLGILTLFTSFSAIILAIHNQ
jgi:hypothetical protein